MTPQRANPFPGPRPYTEADRDRFFGRDRVAQDLQNAILAQRCLTLFSPSGAGKTSLMMARVVPALRAQDFRCVTVESWPGPPARLLLSTLGEGLGLTKAALESHDVRHATEQLVELFLLRSQQPLLLFLDQLEQVFLPDRTEEERRELLNVLRILEVRSQRDLSLCMVLSLREDFLGRWTDLLRTSPSLREHSFRVGRLRVGEMAEAIGRLTEQADPASMDQWRREKLLPLLQQMALSSRSADPGDVEAEVEAAYVQIVCRALWDEANQPRQGPQEVLPQHSAKAIMDSYLHSTLRALGPLEDAAWQLLEHLVAEDGSRAFLTTAQAISLKPSAAQILQMLDQACIVRLETHQTVSVYQLGHDWLAQQVRGRILRWRRQQRWRRAAGSAAFGLAVVVTALLGVSKILQEWRDQELQQMEEKRRQLIEEQERQRHEREAEERRQRVLKERAEIAGQRALQVLEARDRILTQFEAALQAMEVAWQGQPVRSVEMRVMELDDLTIKLNRAARQIEETEVAQRDADWAQLLAQGKDLGSPLAEKPIWEVLLETSAQTDWNEADLQDLSQDYVELLIRGMVARHGKQFDIDVFKRFFQDEPWYQPDPQLPPTTESYNKIKKAFNPTERKNFELLLKLAKAKGGQKGERWTSREPLPKLPKVDFAPDQLALGTQSTTVKGLADLLRKRPDLNKVRIEGYGFGTEEPETKGLARLRAQIVWLRLRALGLGGYRLEYVGCSHIRDGAARSGVVRTVIVEQYHDDINAPRCGW